MFGKTTVTVATCVLLLLSVSIASASLVPPIPDLPVYTVVGSSHYDVGYKLGQLSVNRIAYALKQAKQLIDFVNTIPEGLAVLDLYLANSIKKYPRMVEELQGMADGAGVDLKTGTFLLNAADEMYVVMALNNYSSPDQKKRPSQCSDVATLISRETPSWGHNEDGGIGQNHTTSVANVTILDNRTGAVLDRFVAFSYGGSVGGQAYGFNHHGMLITRNYLTAPKINQGRNKGIPAAVAVRATYAAKTFDEVVEMLDDTQSGIGYNLNVAETIFHSGGLSRAKAHDAPPLRFANIEVDPHGPRLGTKFLRHTDAAASRNSNTSTLDALDYEYHTNVYLSLKMKPAQTPSTDPDSWGRLNRMVEFPPPRTMEDVTSILGDTKNSAYPLYADGANADGRTTLSTVVFDLTHGIAHIYDSNPKLFRPKYFFNLTLA